MSAVDRGDRMALITSAVRDSGEMERYDPS